MTEMNRFLVFLAVAAPALPIGHRPQTLQQENVWAGGQGPRHQKIEPAVGKLNRSSRRPVTAVTALYVGPHLNHVLLVFFTGPPLSQTLTSSRAPRSKSTPPPPPPPPQATHSLLQTCAAAAHQNAAPQNKTSAKYSLFVMAKRSKAEKLDEARVASHQPFRATDSEFGALKLREGFVAAQVTRCVLSIRLPALTSLRNLH